MSLSAVSEENPILDRALLETWQNQVCRMSLNQAKHNLVGPSTGNTRRVQYNMGLMFWLNMVSIRDI